MRRLRRIPLVLSGAREDILELCPSERVKFESLGYAVLTTSVMATVSMWFALNSAMGINGFAAAPLALAWGFMIMGIDRWLITSMPLESRRKYAIAVPRLVLALLLGAVISTPIVLRVFQSEINAQMSAIKQQRYSAFLTAQQDSPVAKQVTSLRKQVSSLQRVIDTRGAAPLDPAADPEVKSLTSQLTYWQGQQKYYYKQWQCQLYGGAGCAVKGNGPLAKSMHTDYLNAQAKAGSLQQKITKRESTLASSSVSEQKSRYDQAVNALPGVERQLKTAQVRQNALLASYYAQDKATNGILIRLQALSQLGNGDFTVTVAHVLLFLLFLVFELLPVSVKLMQRPGIYEKVLQTKQTSELGNANRFFRGQASATPGFATAGGPDTATPGERQPADWRSVWHQPAGSRQPGGADAGADAGAGAGANGTRPMTSSAAASPTAPNAPAAMQFGPWAGQAPPPGDSHGAGYPGQRGDEPGAARLGDAGVAVTRHDLVVSDSGEMPRLDGKLRAMEDERISADPGGDGVQLSWDDE